jgi:preprotein translocase subunit Sss1
MIIDIIIGASIPFAIIGVIGFAVLVLYSLISGVWNLMHIN